MEDLMVTGKGAYLVYLHIRGMRQMSELIFKKFDLNYKSKT